MKKPTIYPDRSQELLALFAIAGNNKKGDVRYQVLYMAPDEVTAYGKLITFT